MAASGNENNQSMDIETSKSPISYQQRHYERVLSNQGFIEIGIHENVQYNQAGEVNGVEYVYEEREEQTNQIKRYHAILKSDEYYQMAKSSQKHVLPFETFIRIFRPFMMGKYAIPDIPEAFHS